jgi:hypothetical protein
MEFFREWSNHVSGKSFCPRKVWNICTNRILRLGTQLEQERDSLNCFALSNRLRKSIQSLSRLIVKVDQFQRTKRMSYTNRIPSVLFGIVMEYLPEDERYTCSAVHSNWKNLIVSLCYKTWIPFVIGTWGHTKHQIELPHGNKIIEAAAKSRIDVEASKKDNAITLAISYVCDIEKNKDNFVLFHVEEKNLELKATHSSYKFDRVFEHIIHVSEPEKYLDSEGIVDCKHDLISHVKGGVERLIYSCGGPSVTWFENTKEYRNVINDDSVVWCCNDQDGIGEIILVSNNKRDSKYGDELYLHVVQNSMNIKDKFYLDTYMEDGYLNEDSLCTMSDEFIYIKSQIRSPLDVYYYVVHFLDEKDNGDKRLHINIFFCHRINIMEIDGFDLTNMCACKKRLFLIHQKQGKKKRKKENQSFLLVYHTNGQLLEKKQLDINKFVVALSVCFNEEKGYVMFIVYEDGSVNVMISSPSRGTPLVVF